MLDMKRLYLFSIAKMILITIYYRGVQKLCTNCFGPHPRQNCQSERVTWVRYCLNFMEKNRKIPQGFYGKWWKIVNQEFGEIIPEENEGRDDQPEPYQAGTSEEQSTPEAAQESLERDTATRNERQKQSKSRNPTNLLRRGQGA